MLKIKYVKVIVLVSCLLSLQGIAQDAGSADDEIAKLVRKAKQYPGRDKVLEELREAFNLANNLNQENIKVILKTGQPDIWYDIHMTYLQLDNRQKLVKQLPEKSISEADLVFTDYKNSLAESKFKAMAYLYAHGEKLLQSDKPENARIAYLEFMKAASLDGSYKNIDKEIRLAILKGATKMEFELQNRTGASLSQAMVDHLALIVQEFNKTREGQIKPDSTAQPFVFILRVIVEELEIGADQVRELEYQEERDIMQGDIVVDTIKCLVRETRQMKKAKLNGSIEYVDKQNGRVVNRIPIMVETIFSNAYASLQGNPDAAGEETVKLLNAGKAEYPGSEQMTRDVTQEFIKKAREIIRGE
jgi:hypothetical protein